MALRLHGYWRSSAAYRARIAFALKGVPFDSVPHDLLSGEQRAPDYRRLAPAGLVPALETPDGPIPQSLAIIEWLEEVYPEPPLLPQRAIDRAIVRAMVATVGCDIHPVNNLRILKYLRREFGRSQEQIDRWIAHWIAEGFAALELMIGEHGRGFAFGGSPTMADCFLVPQVYNAERFRVDLTPYPRLVAAAEAARAHPAFAAAHPDRQPDAKPL